MLYFVILSLFINNLNASPACPVDTLFNEVGKGDRETLNASFTEALNEVQALQQESLQKKEAVLNDPAFQALVTEISGHGSGKMPSSLTPDPLTTGTLTPDIYVFVSFSLGDKALLNLATDAKRYGAILVLRGFKEGSYTKTAKALQKIIQHTGQGFIIDPELFTLFAVTSVPTIVFAKPLSMSAIDRVQTMSSGERPEDPLHDRLQGHVSLKYAFETFSKEGDLREETKSLLKKGGTQ